MHGYDGVPGRPGNAALKTFGIPIDLESKARGRTSIETGSPTSTLRSIISALPVSK